MEDDIILSRPSDRRLVKDDSSLPPGPPGTENDPYDMVKKDSATSKKDAKTSNSRDSRRRSPSSSRDRRSRSRSRGKVRSRSRGRDYSPPADRRRFGNNRNRRSRDRSNRSPPERNRSRENHNRSRDRSRSRGRYRSRRSRSRSKSPMKNRWSPMKKPPSPAMPPPPQYTVPQQYDAYGSYNNQYMGQFPAYDYANHTVPVAYPGTYPCDPQTWSQPPPAPPIQQQIAPQQQPVQITTGETEQEQMKRDAAIAQEAQIQRDQLIKQRNDYMKRAAALKREMKILKDQRSDLVSTKAPPSPTTKGFLEENDRLQSQIQKKLSTIENVIDMLSSIIGEEKTSVTPPAVTLVKKAMQKPKSDDEDDSSSSSPERLKTKLIESMKSKKDITRKPADASLPIKVEKVKEEPVVKTQNDVAPQSTKKINYSFYDPEMHWCITCDVFPKTAKDYLNHLHSEEHAKNSVTPDTPWHENAVNDEFTTFPNAPTKRVPIRGLQFFVPSSGWYCKLCNFWMGDLHCASLHLKSQSHWDKYNQYVEQNPHFEVDWMADRQKILDSVRAKEKCAPPPPQITPVVSTSGMDILESIPLQINNQKLNIDFDKKDKKKKKKEDKKEKKKKKKSKKRKRSSSSSSSSTSVSSSDSESEKKKSKEDRANSIRVAMRNLLPKDEPARTRPVDGKSTAIAAKSIEIGKKDELISQWNTPQPIISESEKKLFENLKGKLKTKTAEDVKKPVIDLTENNKKRGRSPDAKTSETSKNKIKQTSPDRKERRSGSREKTKDARVKNDDKSSPSRGGKERSKSRDKTRANSKSVEKRSGNVDGRNDKRSRSRGRRSRSGDVDRKDRRSRSQDGRRGRDVDRRSRSRGRRDRSRNRRGRASPDRRRGRRSRSAKRSRSPRRSRSRSRRSRSPSNRYGRRKSYSRSRSRSRSRSYRIEKPIVRYPEFRPRVPPPTENKKAKKSDADGDGKKTPPPKKPATTQAPGGKKLPFIGRMPVFKKQAQGGEGDKKDGENMDEYNAEYMAALGYDHYDMNMVMDYDDLMPDPMQYVSLMGAPPPPPSAPPPGEDEKDMLPPGIDESEADTVPKPISDGPRPRKGPLPKDFQEALNIIFPGERRPEEEGATEKESKTDGERNVVKPSTATIPSAADKTAVAANSPNTDDTSQQSAGEAFLGFPVTAMSTGSFSDHTQDVPDIASLVAAVPPPPPPPLPEAKEEEVARKAGKDEPVKTDDKTTMTVKDDSSSPTDKARRQEELDDLAMLGIDADDLAAQCM